MTSQESELVSRENSVKIGVTAENALQQPQKKKQSLLSQQDASSLLSDVAQQQQQNNQARTPVKRNTTEQNLDELTNNHIKQQCYG